MNDMWSTWLSFTYTSVWWAPSDLLTKLKIYCDNKIDGFNVINDLLVMETYQALNRSLICLDQLTLHQFTHGHSKITPEYKEGNIDAVD